MLKTTTPDILINPYNHESLKLQADDCLSDVSGHKIPIHDSYNVSIEFQETLRLIFGAAIVIRIRLICLIRYINN